jgi:hypothetical protein
MPRKNTAAFRLARRNIAAAAKQAEADALILRVKLAPDVPKTAAKPVTAEPAPMEADAVAAPVVTDAVAAPVTGEAARMETDAVAEAAPMETQAVAATQSPYEMMQEAARAAAEQNKLDVQEYETAVKTAPVEQPMETATDAEAMETATDAEPKSGNKRTIAMTVAQATETLDGYNVVIPEEVRGSSEELKLVARAVHALEVKRRKEEGVAQRAEASAAKKARLDGQRAAERAAREAKQATEKAERDAARAATKEAKKKANEAARAAKKEMDEADKAAIESACASITELHGRYNKDSAVSLAASGTQLVEDVIRGLSGEMEFDQVTKIIETVCKRMMQPKTNHGVRGAVGKAFEMALAVTKLPEHVHEQVPQHLIEAQAQLEAYQKAEVAKKAARQAAALAARQAAAEAAVMATATKLTMEAAATIAVGAGAPSGAPSDGLDELDLE